MIISPPFLPNRQPNESDAQFVERAMTGGQPGAGTYPVSYQMNWHGGLHLTAPTGAAASLVRAIADGTVAYKRDPVPVSADPHHPQNYNGGWTDNGCVIIRHETEIGGTAAGATTRVVYFSIYMHLKTIPATVQQGSRIYRKDEVGTAGRIYGTAGLIHFEISCDEANMLAITGRSNAKNVYFNITDAARTNAVFGAMYFTLLVGTPFYASDPTNAPALPPVVYTSDAAQVVAMRFNAGNCTMETLHLGLRSETTPLTETGYEYKLFEHAKKLYPHSQSAGFELLRFGRVLGPDTLTPANAPHWRRVAYPGGSGWVDLNAPTVRKFSDADFPYCKDSRWMLVDGSSSFDSRCQSIEIWQWLGAQGNYPTPQEAQQKLADPDIKDRLSFMICKIQTEWDDSTIDTRFGWLKTDAQTKMSTGEFAKFKAHVSALCFWKQANLGIDGTHWHFHPTRFIQLMRRCGWLTVDEATQLLPRSVATWQQARQRFDGRSRQLSLMLRKYNILSPERQTQFLAQADNESDWFKTTAEYGRGQNHVYDAFYGRGIIQLTWAENYERYGKFRNFPDVGSTYVYQDPRITHTSTHKWAGGNAPSKVWYPRFDPDIAETDLFTAFDSAGFYWVTHGVLALSDDLFNTTSVGNCSTRVNGGLNGFEGRQMAAAYIMRFRGDSTDTTATSSFQVNKMWQGTNHVFNITVHFTPQRP
ncbi:MAG TPA: hypothetical protein VFA65_16015 [Bryobacteraceae bacterium]|nr:hypothetical protein [Bryobacteraceae bacterium]